MCFVSVQREHLKNSYKLLNLEAHIFSSLKIHILQCMGKMFLGNFKRHLSNIHKISFSYLKRFDSYAMLRIWELLNLKAHRCF